MDDQSTYPPEAPKTQLSGFKPNVEAITQHNPDLVVVAGDLNDVVGGLTAVKIPVLLLPTAKTLDEAYAQWTTASAGPLARCPQRTMWSARPGTRSRRSSTRRHASP